ncbi:MAG TPA: precorrin-6y C5,15-methyltransferase (decarboxylating) subunit CbiE, partial [Allocoleopsis sp.]
MIHVIGIGLDGILGLTDQVKHLIDEATLLVGSDRHLSYFPNFDGNKLILKDLTSDIKYIKNSFNYRTDLIVILVSGDPLFFGLGRLLLAEIPAEKLTFHPNLSSVQLAFNRIKVPWQDATIISVHGRNLEQLIKALNNYDKKIALLTDDQNNPHAIANLLLSLNLPISYQFWVCENLGGLNEKVAKYDIMSIKNHIFSSLNIVVLIQDKQQKNIINLPILGIEDDQFQTFSDKPGLITKKEVRMLILGELQLKPNLTIWDIGAGTGSVSIEIARLLPNNKIYAIEKTLSGQILIKQNCEILGGENIYLIEGKAPESLIELPRPDRVFIGGSGGKLKEILDICGEKLLEKGIIVIALATIEHQQIVIEWMKNHNWKYQILQVNLSRSIAIGNLTRFSPLNPVNIIT